MTSEEKRAPAKAAPLPGKSTPAKGSKRTAPDKGKASASETKASGGRSKSASAAGTDRRTRSKRSSGTPASTAAGSGGKVSKKSTNRSQPGRRGKSTNGDGLLPLPSAEAAPKTAPLRKSRLTPAELEEFRQLLLTKRRELLGDMAHLQSEASRTGGGSSSAMPIHMADLGSDTWEQELTLGLIENERGLLREIDEALDRIDERTYGICLGTNKAIAKARLRAKPWAKYCIEYARKRELGLV